MRKIEEEMVKAISQRRNWHSDNTRVANDGEVMRVFLHGHHIASVDGFGHVKANADTLRNWPTNTTKSRLRALDVDVTTKDHVTYLNGRPI